MDLISIRRTYNNRRNLIFIVCILLICVILIITTIEVVNNRRAKKLYLSYLEQVQNAENEAKEQERIAEEQKAKEEEERRKKSPQLTEEVKAFQSICAILFSLSNVNASVFILAYFPPQYPPGNLNK